MKPARFQAEQDILSLEQDPAKGLIDREQSGRESPLEILPREALKLGVRGEIDLIIEQDELVSSRANKR